MRQVSSAENDTHVVDVETTAPDDASSRSLLVDDLTSMEDILGVITSREVSFAIEQREPPAVIALV